MVALSISKKELFGLKFNPELSNILFGEDKTVDAVQLKTGAEADQIIKLTSSKGVFVVKQIKPQNATEEASHIGIINDIYQDFFPKLHALDSKQGVYVIDFVSGSSLDSIIKYNNTGEIPEENLVKSALKKLNQLHQKTINVDI
ncbi:MAG: hypothetical protein RLZZ210_923 [Pseudomonadota bacterium]|jgi:hypothetical protein